MSRGHSFGARILKKGKQGMALDGTGTAILGGGALGLTLAYRLALAGEHVTLYEREPLAGGLAGGFHLLLHEAADAESGPWLEKFYHHLFHTDADAIALIG